MEPFTVRTNYYSYDLLYKGNRHYIERIRDPRPFYKIGKNYYFQKDNKRLLCKVMALDGVETKVFMSGFCKAHDIKHRLQYRLRFLVLPVFNS